MQLPTASASLRLSAAAEGWRYITASELTELDAHGWAGDIRQLIDEGFVVVGGSLTPEEKEKAERAAKQIASDPASDDPDWLTHLPEAEAVVLVMERRSLMIDLTLILMGSLETGRLGL